MIVRIKLPVLKFFIFTALAFGVIINSYSQNARKGNLLADIKSVDLAISIIGDHQVCGLNENDIRSAVGYTLSNSPLRRIDADSLDFLSISIMAQNDKTVGGKSLGCSVVINFRLRRIVKFKGEDNFVTVWDRLMLQAGQEKDIGGLVGSAVEKTTKEFIVNWTEQN